MHTNHRRTNKYRAKHHGTPWPLIYSCKPMRRESWQKRRAQTQSLLRHERFDDLPTRYVADIYWNYW